MVVTDPSIDPITGLPVLNSSGPVQQIPLGAQVFPFADLNATAQPTRGPIYGDDIIPTSGLVTAPDVMKKPRSIQSTTTRELRVREAVFQNLGAAIPDGETAPVDVNVVYGGGGGGGGITPEDLNCDSGSMIVNAGSGTSGQVLHSFNVSGHTVVTGFRFRLKFNIPDDTAFGNTQIWLQGYKAGGVFTGQTIYLLYEVGDPWDPADYPLRYEVERDIQFVTPIDIATTWPGALTVRMEAVVESFRALGNGAMYYF